MNLVTLEFLGLQITDRKTGESLSHFSIGVGDVVVADRGYCRTEELIQAAGRGAQVVVRFIPSNVPAWDESGQPIDWVKQLRKQKRGTIQTVAVEIRSKSGTGCLTAWVHAYRLNKREAEAALRACHRRRQRNGSTPKAETLLYAEFVLIVTTVPPEEVSAQTILAVYRCRWQIEIAIKRWKSLLDVDQLRSHETSPLSQVWMSGKLLYALLIERRGRHRVGDAWTRLDQTRQGTWWHMWHLMVDQVTPLITGARFWKQDQWESCRTVMSERPRKRKLQSLPRQAIDFLYTSCQKTQDESRKTA